MSLDLSQLLGTQRAIRAARADYDAARDPLTVGNHAIQSEVIPASSIVVGWAVYTTADFTFTGGGSLLFVLGASSLSQPNSSLPRIRQYYPSDENAIVTPADLPVTAQISTGPCTAGEATIWVFYLPTTG